MVQEDFYWKHLTSDFMRAYDALDNPLAKQKLVELIASKIGFVTKPKSFTQQDVQNGTDHYDHEVQSLLQSAYALALAKKEGKTLSSTSTNSHENIYSLGYGDGEKFASEIESLANLEFGNKTQVANHRNEEEFNYNSRDFLQAVYEDDSVARKAVSAAGDLSSFKKQQEIDYLPKVGPNMVRVYKELQSDKSKRAFLEALLPKIQYMGKNKPDTREDIANGTNFFDGECKRFLNSMYCIALAGHENQLDSDHIQEYILLELKYRRGENRLAAQLKNITDLEQEFTVGRQNA